ncbi:hypothetical protein B0H13DRAFT_2470116 [Mycena leptocephala]|nr:hypothetical protein B0H13DRAFT_2470116 [Mycena leptocephala]
MLFSTFVSLAFTAASVQALAVPVSTIVNIQDFKGSVFDLAFGNASELSPVQAFNHKPGTTAQAWLIEAGVAPGLFTIQNIAAGTFLSSTGAITQLNPTSTQLCGHARAFQWNITANGMDSSSSDLLRSSARMLTVRQHPRAEDGEGATSWASSTSSIIGLTTPVTLQSFDPAATQQLFHLPACLSLKVLFQR